MLYLVMMMYVSYYATGIVGLGVILISTLITTMRVWDGVTDPIIGFVLDRTNGRFGKNRPFILIGNLIMLATSFSLFHFTHLLTQKARLPFFLGIYVIYIIGYTCQGVVSKSAQTCLTNDPKQRPTYAIFDGVYTFILTAVISLLISNYLIPKYKVGDVSGLRNPALFHEMWIICASISIVTAILAIIGLWRKDRPEYYGLGTKGPQVRIRDYFDVIRHNRAIQMLVISASSDKLAASIQTNSIVMVMLYGVICGNIRLMGQVNMIVMIPNMVILFLGIRFIASRLGQKRALIVGTLGAMIATCLNFLLFLTGDPSTLSFTSINLFTVLFILFWVLAKGFAGISGSIVIPMTADCADYEIYRTRRYVPGFMGTLFSFVDKIISSFAALIVGLMIAFIGFKDIQPTETTAYSDGIFWVTCFLLFGVPMIGWILNLISMKFYPLTKEKMEEVQREVLRIKTSLQNGDNQPN
jgi:Na+/melibiose symporter-like transporter